MQKKISIVSLLISILLIITIFIGTSYSLWTTSVHQESTNTVDVGCFRIEFSDEGIVGAGNISIDKAYPIQDDVGKTLVPYKFTIANQCTVASSYNVILETLNTSTMDESKLDVYFNDTSIKHYSSNVSNGLSEDAKNGMNLTKGYLGAGESITYSLRVWIDYDVTTDTPDVQGKVWNGRIVVNSEATFTKPAFTNKVVGEDNVTLDIDTKNDKTVQTLECYYGNKISQNEVGTAIGTTKCQYPLTAEYAKFKVTYTDGTTDSSYPLKLIETISLIDKMIDLKSKGATDLEYDGTATLGANGTEDNNLRYIGATPNNYVYFNCSTTNPLEMNDSTCEKWRIIGLFNNIEDNNGISASRVKIIRDLSLGEYSWDTSDSSINDGAGINQWGPSGTYEGADLMRELNTDYLGNITVGTDSKWYDGSWDDKNTDKPESILNSNAQEMIKDVKWNIGTFPHEVYEQIYNEDYSMLSIKNLYGYERSNNSGMQCDSAHNCDDVVTRTTSWIGKIALFYPSDFAYTTTGGTTKSKEECLSASLYDWNDSRNKSLSDCKKSSWMYTNDYTEWTITPFPINDDASGLFSIGQYIFQFSASSNLNVRPAVFLQSSITIAEGNGSESSPYRLIME